MRKLAINNGLQAIALAFAIALVAMACALLCPGRAFAADAVAHVVDYNGKDVGTYTSIDDAVKAGTFNADDQHTKTIVMDADWSVSKALTVADNMALIIDMNGHKISLDGKDSVFRLGKGSKLTLKSSKSADFSFSGYNLSGDQANCKITSGGLVTGGYVSNSGAGINMGSNSSLTLDGVAVAGNNGNGSGAAGGIRTEGDCDIVMRNGATIQYNRGSTGGITVQNEDNDKGTSITMDNASISNNFGYRYGGGIYSNADATKISMTNGSTISSNVGDLAGAGVYFNYGRFSLESSDNTGSIKNNKTNEPDDGTITLDGEGAADDRGGAAVYVDGASQKDRRGTIKGLTISGNTSAVSGGAVYVNAAYTSISDCSITGNTAARSGGGVCVKGSDFSLSNCTITGNVCNTAGDNYEGGGVYVDNDYDITLSGKCTITGNTRGQNGSSDDLFLDSGWSSQAYILGGVDAGSSVGIRTGNTDKSQMVGKNISTYADGTYFMDLEEYRITHGSDHDGDLWQRRVDPATHISLEVKTPRTDYELPTTAVLYWGVGGSKEVPITWYDESGNKVTKAQHEGKYYFKLNTSEDLDCGLTFPNSIQTSDVELVTKVGLESQEVKDAHIDSNHCLDVTSNIIQAVDPKGIGGEDGMEKVNGKTSGAVDSSAADASSSAAEQVSAAGSRAVLVQTGDPLPMGVFAIVAAGALVSVAVGAFALRRSRR